MTAEQVKRCFFTVVELGAEMVHSDFKREFFSPNTENIDDARVQATNKILEDIMAMYNAPINAGTPYDSTTGEKQQCSFLIFGIEYTNSSKKFKAYPFDDPKRPIIDETEFQLLMRDRLNLEITIQLHPVDVSMADIPSHSISKLRWLVKNEEKLNRYYLLEIRQNYRFGPVFVTKKITSRAAKLKGKKNELYGQLLTRTQATNHTSISARNFQTPEHKKLVQDVFAKFDSGYRDKKYSGQIETISKSRSKGGAFRVLVINQMVDQMENICTAWSSIKWNLILDLDGQSGKSGALSLMKDKLLLDVTVATYADLEGKDFVRALELKQVQKSAACLYLLLSGDSAIRLNRPPVFPKTNLASMTKELFSRKETDAPLEIYVIVNSHIDLQEVSLAVKSVLSTWGETCMTQDSSYFAMFTHKKLHEVVASYMEKELKEETSDWIEAVAPWEQIEQFFTEMMGPNQPKLDGKIVIPSSGGGESGCIISKLELQKIQKQFVLYHKFMGSEIDQRKDVTEFVPQLTTNYLRGFEATPDLLYVNEHKQKAFAERKLHDEVLRKLRKKLNDCEPAKVTMRSMFPDQDIKQGEKAKTKPKRERKEKVLKDIVLLHHEPSAGGTTLGRSILWDLRQEFPCLELLPWSKDSFSDIEDAVRLVYFKARAPVCILIDTSTVGGHTRFSDVQELIRQLQSISQNDDCVEVVVFFVQGVHVGHSEDTSLTLLTTMLSPFEQKEFDMLYERAAKRMQRTPVKTVALYGLCQFSHKYHRLEKDLDVIKESAPQLDKSMLLLCSVTRRYSKLSFPLTLAGKLLKFECGCKDPEKILNSLSSARNLLLVECSDVEENRTNGLHTPTTFVAEKVIDVVFGKKEALHQFVDEISELVDESAPVKNAIEHLLNPIFIQRNVTFNGDGERGKKERFSDFVQDLEKYSTSDDKQLEAANILKKMVVHLGHTMPHFQAMLARYLAYNLKEIDWALQEMKAALRVQPEGQFSSTNCTDTTLLTTAGHLISIKLNTLAGTTTAPDPIENAKLLMRDAMEILGRAQKAQTNVYPFVIESRLLYFYVHLYFRKVFKGDRKALSNVFQKYGKSLEI